MPYDAQKCEALAINKDGLAVGYSYSTTANYTAMLWQNGQQFDMNHRLSAAANAAGWRIGKLWDINDNGVIVASGYRSGYGGLVLLVPDPAVQLITPGGDPVNAPVDNPPPSCGGTPPTNVDGQNEFTFDNCTSGVLRCA